jgi:uncharacterized protein (TIGR02300 family)
MAEFAFDSSCGSWQLATPFDPSATSGVCGVAKPEWGTKRICLSCGARFYDFQKPAITCPACGTLFDPAAQSKPRRARAPVKIAPVQAQDAELQAGAVEEEAETEVDVNEEEEEAAVAEDSGEEEEDSDSAIEDVSELGDDDMADVIDTEIEDEDTER